RCEGREANVRRRATGLAVAARRRRRRAVPQAAHAGRASPRQRRPRAVSGDLWEQHVKWWHDGFTAGADPGNEEQMLALAAEHLVGARRVLDVGCGEGQFSRLATRLGAAAIGVDPTWGQVTEATRRGGGPVYSRAEAARLPFADATFDAVVACLVFEHIE